MEWIVTRDGGPKVNKDKHEGEYLLYQKYYKSKERKASRINSVSLLKLRMKLL